MIGVLSGFRSCIRGTACIHTELWTPDTISTSLTENFHKAMIRVADQSAKTTHLVRDQCVHGIHDNRAYATKLPTVCSISGLISKLRHQGPHKTLSFTRACTSGHKQIFPSEGCLQSRNLMAEGCRIDTQVCDGQLGKIVFQPVRQYFGILYSIFFTLIGRRGFNIRFLI